MKLLKSKLIVVFLGVLMFGCKKNDIQNSKLPDEQMFKDYLQESGLLFSSGKLNIKNEDQNNVGELNWSKMTSYKKDDYEYRKVPFEFGKSTINKHFMIFRKKGENLEAKVEVNGFIINNDKTKVSKEKYYYNLDGSLSEAWVSQNGKYKKYLNEHILNGSFNSNQRALGWTCTESTFTYYVTEVSWVNGILTATSTPCIGWTLNCSLNGYDESIDDISGYVGTGGGGNGNGGNGDNNDENIDEAQFNQGVVLLLNGAVFNVTTNANIVVNTYLPTHKDINFKSAYNTYWDVSNIAQFEVYKNSDNTIHANKPSVISKMNTNFPGILSFTHKGVYQENAIQLDDYIDYNDSNNPKGRVIRVGKVRIETAVPGFSWVSSSTECSGTLYTSFTPM